MKTAENGKGSSDTAAAEAPLCPVDHGKTWQLWLATQARSWCAPTTDPKSWSRSRAELGGKITVLLPLLHLFRHEVLLPVLRLFKDRGKVSRLSQYLLPALNSYFEKQDIKRQLDYNTLNERQYSRPTIIIFSFRQQFFMHILYS